MSNHPTSNTVPQNVPPTITISSPSTSQTNASVHNNNNINNNTADTVSPPPPSAAIPVSFADIYTSATFVNSLNNTAGSFEIDGGGGGGTALATGDGSAMISSAATEARRKGQQTQQVYSLAPTTASGLGGAAFSSMEVHGAGEGARSRNLSVDNSKDTLRDKAPQSAYRTSKPHGQRKAEDDDEEQSLDVGQDEELTPSHSGHSYHNPADNTNNTSLLASTSPNAHNVQQGRSSQGRRPHSMSVNSRGEYVGVIGGAAKPASIGAIAAAGSSVFSSTSSEFFAPHLTIAPSVGIAVAGGGVPQQQQHSSQSQLAGSSTTQTSSTNQSGGSGNSLISSNKNFNASTPSITPQTHLLGVGNNRLQPMAIVVPPSTNMVGAVPFYPMGVPVDLLAAQQQQALQLQQQQAALMYGGANTHLAAGAQGYMAEAYPFQTLQPPVAGTALLATNVVGSLNNSQQVAESQRTDVTSGSASQIIVSGEHHHHDGYQGTHRSKSKQPGLGGHSDIEGSPLSVNLVGGQSATTLLQATNTNSANNRTISSRASQDEGETAHQRHLAQSSQQRNQAGNQSRSPGSMNFTSGTTAEVSSDCNASIGSSSAAGAAMTTTTTGGGKPLPTVRYSAIQGLADNTPNLSPNDLKEATPVGLEDALHRPQNAQFRPQWAVGTSTSQPMSSNTAVPQPLHILQSSAGVASASMMPPTVSYVTNPLNPHLYNPNNTAAAVGMGMGSPHTSNATTANLLTQSSSGVYLGNDLVATSSLAVQASFNTELSQGNTASGEFAMVANPPHQNNYGGYYNGQQQQQHQYQQPPYGGYYAASPGGYYGYQPPPQQYYPQAFSYPMQQPMTTPPPHLHPHVVAPTLIAHTQAPHYQDPQTEGLPPATAKNHRTNPHYTHSHTFSASSGATSAGVAPQGGSNQFLNAYHPNSGAQHTSSAASTAQRTNSQFSTPPPHNNLLAQPQQYYSGGYPPSISQNAFESQYNNNDNNRSATKTKPKQGGSQKDRDNWSSPSQAHQQQQSNNKATPNLTTAGLPAAVTAGSIVAASLQQLGGTNGINPFAFAPNDERRILAERFKTQSCRTFEAKGRCKYSYHCMFAHGPEELRTLELNLAEGLYTEAAIDAFRRTQRFLQRKAAGLAVTAPSGIVLPQELLEGCVQGPNTIHHNANGVASDQVGGDQSATIMPTDERRALDHHSQTPNRSSNGQQQATANGHRHYSTSSASHPFHHAQNHTPSF